MYPREVPHCIISYSMNSKMGLPWWLSGKESACKAEDVTSIPGSGRFPGEGNGNTLQYSCLGNSMDRVAWWATAQRIAKGQIRLNDEAHSDITTPFYNRSR